MTLLPRSVKIYMPPPPPPKNLGGETLTPRSLEWRACLLVLAVVMGVTLLASRACAQTAPNPASWRSVTPGIAIEANRWDINTTSLTAATIQQSVEIYNTFSSGWYRADIYACPWASVTPTDAPRARNLPTNCGSTIYTGNVIGAGSNPTIGNTRSVNITPTQTMITNGGVVIVIFRKFATNGIMYTKWIPLIPPAAR